MSLSGFLQSTFGGKSKENADEAAAAAALFAKTLPTPVAPTRKRARQEENANDSESDSNNSDSSSVEEDERKAKRARSKAPGPDAAKLEEKTMEDESSSVEEGEEDDGSSVESDQGEGVDSGSDEVGSDDIEMEDSDEADVVDDDKSVKKNKKIKNKASAEEEEEEEEDGDIEDADLTAPLELSGKEAKALTAADKASKARRTVFVSNVSLSVTPKELKKFFKQWGKVEAAWIRGVAIETSKPMPRRVAAFKRAGTVVDKAPITEDKNKEEKSKKPKFGKRQTCFGFVTMETEGEAKAAAAGADSMVWFGFHLRTDIEATGAGKKVDESRSVFVGNLPFEVEEQDLRNWFNDGLALTAEGEAKKGKKAAQPRVNPTTKVPLPKGAKDPKAVDADGDDAKEGKKGFDMGVKDESGAVASVRVIRDSKTWMGKGYAYVMFRRRDQVWDALLLNGRKLNGRTVRVRQALRQGPGKEKAMSRWRGEARTERRTAQLRQSQDQQYRAASANGRGAASVQGKSPARGGKDDVVLRGAARRINKVAKVNEWKARKAAVATSKRRSARGAIKKANRPVKNKKHPTTPTKK